MINKDLIEKIEKKTNEPFGDYTRRIFLPCYEEILASYILGNFLDRIQNDLDLFLEEAIELYYTPYVVSERIVYEEFSRITHQNSFL